jgi:hypothetical protein
MHLFLLVPLAKALVHMLSSRVPDVPPIDPLNCITQTKGRKIKSTSAALDFPVPQSRANHSFSFASNAAELGSKSANHFDDQGTLQDDEIGLIAIPNEGVDEDPYMSLEDFVNESLYPEVDENAEHQGEHEEAFQRFDKGLFMHIPSWERSIIDLVSDESKDGSEDREDRGIAVAARQQESRRQGDWCPIPARSASKPKCDTLMALKLSSIGL